MPRAVYRCDQFHGARRRSSVVRARCVDSAVAVPERTGWLPRWTISTDLLCRVCQFRGTWTGAVVDSVLAAESCGPIPIAGSSWRRFRAGKPRRGGAYRASAWGGCGSGVNFRPPRERIRESGAFSMRACGLKTEPRASAFRLRSVGLNAAA